MSDILRNRPNFDERRGKGDAASIPLVYVVDDDDDFREEMVFGLASLGLNTHGFESAAALYRAYAAKPSDIVILDVGLKGKTGCPRPRAFENIAISRNYYGDSSRFY